MMDIEFEISLKVAWQIEPSENFVYIQNVSKGIFYKLENVEKDIWLAIVAKKSLLEIEESIALLYDIAIIEIEQDIKEFVLAMALNDLINIKSL